jgi:hypothetical protein
MTNIHPDRLKFVLAAILLEDLGSTELLELRERVDFVIHNEYHPPLSGPIAWAEIKTEVDHACDRILTKFRSMEEDISFLYSPGQ